MTTPWLLFGLLTTIALPAARAESPPPVLVTTADENGQGFLMTRLDRCLAVTAAHVMKDRQRATLVGSYDDRPLDGEGALIAADVAADVAVLEVTGPLSRRCGVDFIQGASPQALRATAAAVLAHVPPSGKLGREPLIVVDVREKDLIVAPPPGREAALGGFSGSLITVDDQPAAMILAVVGTRGESRAIRYDRLVAMAREMADAHPRVVASSGVVDGGRKTTAINYANRDAGAGVIRWSSPPTRPELAASNLVAQASDAPWEVPSSGSLVSVDLALAGESVVAVGSVRTSIKQVAIEKRPLHWEISTSIDGQSWALAFSGDFETSGSDGLATFPPRRARYLRLRIAGNPKQSSVSIGPLVVN